MDKKKYNFINEHKFEFSQKVDHFKFIDLIKNQEFGVLTTSFNNNPYSTLVAFIFDERANSVFFVTSHYTRKFQYIESNNKVSFFVDNRDISENFIHINTVCIQGTVNIIKNISKVAYIKHLITDKYPYLNELCTSKACVTLKIQIKEIFFVTKVHEVQQVSINGNDRK